MATSRYRNFRTVKSFPTDKRRLETFPSLSMRWSGDLTALWFQFPEGYFYTLEVFNLNKYPYYPIHLYRVARWIKQLYKNGRKLSNLPLKLLFSYLKWIISYRSCIFLLYLKAYNNKYAFNNVFTCFENIISLAN